MRPWRLIRRLLSLVVLVVLAAVGFVLWGIFWPRPSGAPSVPCNPHHVHPCISVSGRILYHTRIAAGRTAHVVLLSRQSRTLPGISVIELPELASGPSGLGVGDWISARGAPATGSHHEHDVHVTRFATSSVAIDCGNFGSGQPCRRVPRR